MMKFENMEVNVSVCGVKKAHRDRNITSIPLRVHVGDVEPNQYGVKELSNSLQHAPIVEFEDGTIISIPWDALIDLAINVKAKYEKGEYEEEKE